MGKGQKVKYHSISITKSISKLCISNFVCVSTNERFMYKTYQTGFAFCRLGHAPGVGLGGAGVKNFSVGICDGALSTAHSSFFLVFLIFSSMSCLYALKLL